MNDVIRIADHYGLRHQLNKLIEELDELKRPALSAALDLIISREIDQETRTQLIDEMADVTIMIRQIAYLLGAADEVEQRVEFKIERQLDRMDNENTPDA